MIFIEVGEFSLFMIKRNVLSLFITEKNAVIVYYWK